MPFLRVLWSILLLAGCGDDDARPDADATVDGRGDSDSDASSDATQDVDADAAPTDRCDESEACAGRREGELCVGRCVASFSAPSCAGVIVDGLCDGASNTPPRSDSFEGDGLRVAVTSAPERAVVGEEHEIEVTFTNTATTPREIGATFTLSPYWEYVSGDIGAASIASFTLANGESRAVRGRLRATLASVVDHDRLVFALSVDGIDLGRRGFRARLPIFEGASGIACAGARYPDTHISSEGSFFTARCCDEVFYPAADCCGPSDCEGRGQCIDGRCVADAPMLPYGSSPARGRFRILVVRLDEPGLPPGRNLCDAVPIAGFPLDLDGVEADWKEMAAARLGSPDAIEFDWQVITGLRKADLGIVAYDTTVEGLMALERAVETRLQAAGCVGSFDADYDRVVLFVPEAGDVGIVYDADRTAISSSARLTLVHELAHTFGAFDLYNDLGGAWQWSGSLAGAGTRSLRSDVSWGEVGWADTDRDGVIDAYQWVRAPTTLAISNAIAIDSGFDIEVRFEIEGEGPDGAGRVLLRHVTVDVPGTSATQTIELREARRDTMRTLYSARFGPPSIDLPAIRAAGAIQVHVTGDHYGTGDTIGRMRATLDETRSVPLMSM